MFEFGFGQAEAVAGLISSTRGLRMIELHRDLQDIPRIAIARRARPQPAARSGPVAHHLSPAASVG